MKAKTEKQVWKKCDIQWLSWALGFLKYCIVHACEKYQGFHKHVHISPADADQKSPCSLTLSQAGYLTVVHTRINHLNKLLILSVKVWQLTYCTLLASNWCCTSNHATHIYIYAFGRCILSVQAFPGNLTHDFAITIFTFKLKYFNFNPKEFKLHIPSVQIDHIIT